MMKQIETSLQRFDVSYTTTFYYLCNQTIATKDLSFHETIHPLYMYDAMADDCGPDRAWCRLDVHVGHLT